MATAPTVELMTTAELLALPEDGTERYLIRGELREKAVTKRNRFHSSAEARIAHLLWDWIETQPEPRGEVFSGEAGVVLRVEPDSTVGIDVAYFTADQLERQPDDTTLIVGAPVLAVEVLSPSDTQETIEEKLDEYLTAGVPVVWIVNPRRRTVTIHRPGQPPEFANETMTLTAEPHLPGFSAPVSSFFRRGL